MGIDCGTATQARAVPCSLGLYRSTVKGYILTKWPARWAGWPAVDAGRGHGEYEVAIGIAIARENCVPISALKVVMISTGTTVIAKHRLRIGWDRHMLCQIEYRIGCHDSKVYGGPPWLDYPDLAVKLKLFGDGLDSGKVRARCAAEGGIYYPLVMRCEEPATEPEDSGAADLSAQSVG
jgi:hypothetical protein